MIYTLDRITKHYLTRAGRVVSLDELSLDVRPGEQVALIGKSGAGKTTLFRLLNATLRPTSGTLRFNGSDIGTLSGRELRQVRRRIGTVYQQHHLVPSLSALDNTLCGRLGQWSLFHTVRTTIRPSRRDAEEALHALELVGLADKRRARADELSGGQQQRLAIARMLMQNPEVILADEPVASLDPALSEAITSLLVRLAGDGSGRTLIVALHDVKLALSYFRRVVGMRGGRVVLDEQPAGVDADKLTALFTDDGAKATGPEQNDADTGRELRCLR